VTGSASRPDRVESTSQTSRERLEVDGMRIKLVDTPRIANR
jgi:hypothetical protein